MFWDGYRVKACSCIHGNKRVLKSCPFQLRLMTVSSSDMLFYVELWNKNSSAEISFCFFKCWNQKQLKDFFKKLILICLQCDKRVKNKDTTLSLKGKGRTRERTENQGSSSRNVWAIDFKITPSIHVLLWEWRVHNQCAVYYRQRSREIEGWDGGFRYPC